MERLTKRDNSGRAVFSGDGSPVENVNKIPAILCRLAAYEDTGLEPGEIKSLVAEFRVNLAALDSYRKANHGELKGGDE